MKSKKNPESLEAVYTHTHTGNLEKKRKIKNISMLVLVILALLCVAIILINPSTRQTILSSINGNIENVNINDSNPTETINDINTNEEVATLSDDSNYKKTSDLTDADLTDDYQKNYQESSVDDGSYLTKSAEWADKENGEALITIKGKQIQELEDTSALYVATMCYAHELTEDIVVKNIQTLIQYYDYVDFVAINNYDEEGIVSPRRFTTESTESEIRTAVSEIRESGYEYPHFICSIPVAIQKYLFGNIGDSYISEDNLINDPTAIYVSCDSIYLNDNETYGREYATEKYFNFIEERYGDRYFSMSQTSKQQDSPTILIRYSNVASYNSGLMNIIIGILNPENYGEADSVLSEGSLNRWNSSTVEHLSLPYTDKKYAADYSYDRSFEEANVPIITNCTISDTVKDCFEIVDVEATGGSSSMQTRVNGQNVLFYDENYVCGDEVTLKIKVKLRQDVVTNFDGFEDTNVGNARLNGSVSVSTESPKLAAITNNYKVNYLEKGTNKVLSTAKLEENVPINTKVEAIDEAININGYKYDSADKESITIGTNEAENVINIYYTKRTDLSYKVNYLEKGTNNVISTQKVVNGQTFENVIKSADEIIQIYGYNYDSADKEILTIGTGENVINLYYVKKESSVVVHHYIYDVDTDTYTEEKIVEDETIKGVVGQEYKTTKSEDIPNNYVCINETPEKYTGEMTEEVIEVTYYYKLKDPIITTPELTKESSLDKITSEEQNVDYTINYKTTIKEYIGDATVTIVDELPYEIDESKTYNLAGGEYNKENRTITWVEEITGIDTWEDGDKVVDITKEINFSYKNVDVTQKAISNNVKGTVSLSTPKKEEITETTKEIPTEYKVNITANKVWNDNEEQASRRPESVILVVKNGNTEVASKEVTGTTNKWTVEFTGLDKYDSSGNEIQYTIEEKEKNSGDLKFYTSSVDGTTVTNTFSRPTDVISIEVTKNWVDQENVYNKRPVSVRVNVRNNGEVVQTAVVTKDVMWKHTFTNLAKYDENGQEILYTVDEEEVMENDLYYYTGTSSLVTNKSGETDVKEATITNEMTKIPGKVVVKYVDKNTGLEISEEKVKEDAVGETFDVTNDVKEIEGYTLVGEPPEKTGTYTAETQEKIYYYAKNTRVIVKYLEKDSTDNDADNKVLSDEIILGGYEGQSYTTNSKVIDGYTLVETKGNLSGTMTREEQVVVYYYAKNTKVIVKYLEQDNTPNDTSDNNVLASEDEILGYVRKEYTTTEETIPNYTLVEKTTNYEGTMTEDVIEVVYYYAQNTNVIVKYLEKDNTLDNNNDNAVLAEEVVISGYEGKEYETEKKDINNYTFVEDTGNTSGKMTKEQIEVIYYYAQNTKAKVEHIDRETGKILKEETTSGKVGDLFETHPEDFEGYVLVQEPEEPNIIMDKTGEQVVKYYYAHVSAGVVEKHIDVITGELLDSAEHSGNEGDPYNIPSKTFEGYDLVKVDENGDNMLPTNATGTMLRDDVIEVKYYYIKKASVVVKYVDENTGEEIEEQERIEGHENDEYSTEAKDIDDYNLTKTPDNGSGTMTVTKNPDGTYDTEIEVIYYYKKIAGGVIENHIDVHTDEKLATEKHTGNVGDEYDIPSRTFEDYDLVTDRLPDNSKGTMTEEEIVVNYYYSKRAKVTVEYIDKLTGEKITEDVIINGHIGDEYKTEEKTFDGYDLVEKPSNGEGEMKEEETVVKYHYQRKAEVEVKYLEKGTDYEVAPSETISGYVADKYETEQKDVPYYNFVEKTENWKGEMTEEKITVIYYYEKQTFNLGVDKWVESVNVNGISSPAQNINSSDEMYKVDVHRSKADTADIKITYKIRITNKGEIEGTVGNITDIIPAGTTFNQEDNNIYWDNNNGILSTDDLADEVIKPGEYKEIEVTLRVNKGSENFGEKDNMVILTETSNPAGYEDVDREDNSDTSSMILSVATGLDRNNIIVKIGIVQIVLGITIVVLMSYKKKEKYNNK